MILINVLHLIFLCMLYIHSITLSLSSIVHCTVYIYFINAALSVNTTLSGPLLSRFDIVLVLLDTKNPEWDVVVSSHILAEVTDKLCAQID